MKKVFKEYVNRITPMIIELLKNELNTDRKSLYRQIPEFTCFYTMLSKNCTSTSFVFLYKLYRGFHRPRLRGAWGAKTPENEKIL